MLSFIFSWNTLWWLMLSLYIPICFALVVIVLMQKAKGTGFAGAFGMGGSEAVFGPRTARSLPQKMTYTMGGIFLFMAVIFSLVAGKVGHGDAPGLLPEDSEEALQSDQMDALFGGEPLDDLDADEPPAAPAFDVDFSPTPLDEEAPAPEAPLELEPEAVDTDTEPEAAEETDAAGGDDAADADAAGDEAAL